MIKRKKFDHFVSCKMKLLGTTMSHLTVPIWTHNTFADIVFGSILQKKVTRDLFVSC